MVTAESIEIYIKSIINRHGDLSIDLPTGSGLSFVLIKILYNDLIKSPDTEYIFITGISIIKDQITDDMLTLGGVKDGNNIKYDNGSKIRIITIDQFIREKVGFKNIYDKVIFSNCRFCNSNSITRGSLSIGVKTSKPGAKMLLANCGGGAALSIEIPYIIKNLTTLNFNDTSTSYDKFNAAIEKELRSLKIKKLKERITL